MNEKGENRVDIKRGKRMRKPEERNKRRKIKGDKEQEEMTEARQRGVAECDKRSCGEKRES